MALSRRITHLMKRPNALASRLIAGRRFSPIVRIEHTGRRSGQRYETPLMAFSTPTELIVVLTYGPDVDWRRNLAATGSGTLIQHGRKIPVGAPTVTNDLARITAIPWLTRQFLGMMGVTQVARLPRLAPATTTAASSAPAANPVP